MSKCRHWLFGCFSFSFPNQTKFIPSVCWVSCSLSVLTLQFLSQQCLQNVINLKGTVSRDFLLLVFFMNQFPPSPKVFHLNCFEFFAKIHGDIRESSQGAPPVSTTLVANLPAVSTTPVAKLPPVSMTPVANLPPVSATPAANFSAIFASVVDTGGKFATGVVDTGGK